ncbi:hypothetical protein H4S14_000366 [Agrobacterium vitis]|nr:hypothetical protein [Agrobacterium vitis]MBE1436639.1 hypothetical protein [Agrobacterium vitis]
MSDLVSTEISTLVARMREAPAVAEAWDVALNLSEAAMQALVSSRWNAKPTLTKEERALVWLAPAQVGGQHDILKIVTDLALPSTTLDTSAQTVKLGFTIDSGQMQTGKVPTETVARANGNPLLIRSEEVEWSKPVEISDNNPLYLNGQWPIEIHQADDNLTFSIELNLTAGKMALTSPISGGIDSQVAEQAVQSWLSNQHLSGQLMTFSRKPGAAATTLTATKIKARLANALDGQPVLQIVLGSAPETSDTIENSPVYHPAGYDFSAQVSSRATMSIIASAYNQGTGKIKLVSAPPNDGQLHWFTQVHQPMVFSGTFSNPNGTVYLTDQSNLFMCFGGSADQGLRLFTHIDPSSTVHLQLDLAAHYPTIISGTGADQCVCLSEGAQSVTGDGFYENIVRPQLEKFLTGDIKSDMTRVRLSAVSDLLLRELSVSGHALTFEVSALPAELLIAGNLTPIL